MNIFKSLFGSNRYGTVSINGREFVGNSITITREGTIIVDGVSKDIVNQYEVQVDVYGDPETVTTTSGDITIAGDVKGNTGSVSGDIECGSVGGNVSTTSGDVQCGRVAGNVSTVSGDVRKHK